MHQRRHGRPYVQIKLIDRVTSKVKRKNIYLDNAMKENWPDVEYNPNNENL